MLYVNCFLNCWTSLQRRMHSGFMSWHLTLSIVIELIILTKNGTDQRKLYLDTYVDFFYWKVWTMMANLRKTRLQNVEDMNLKFIKVNIGFLPQEYWQEVQVNCVVVSRYPRFWCSQCGLADYWTFHRCMSMNLKKIKIKTHTLIKELKLLCHDFRGKLIWDDNLR